ncbi:APC family permease [Caldivirga sp. UBA161]|uniref:APC family permease n=1 Tax=Caldivirga sp. UBA161 TaxID=1915569 RepID=UPI0025BF839E|nr:APC family permease [Caldivirga sp. UBA161]
MDIIIIMENRHIKLRRTLKTMELFALGYSDVSSTYYFSMGVIALYSGSSLPVVMLLGSIPLWVAGLTYAELGSAIPEAGGAYYYVRHELGRVPGFIAGWLLDFDQILMVSYGAVGFTGYLSVLIEGLRIWPVNVVLSLIMIWALAIINIIGIKPSARFNLVLVAIDLVGIITLMAFGVYAIIHQPHHVGFSISFTIPAIGLAYALRGYTGIDVIAQSAGEALLPGHSVPRSIIAVCTLSTVVALALSTITSYSGLTQYIARNLSDPLGALAVGLLGHGLLSMYISSSIALVMLLSINAGIVDYSRSIYSMSNDSLMPKQLAVIHPRFRTPYLSIIAASFIASLFVLSNDVELIVGSYGIASMITYSLAILALIKFKSSNKPSGFQTPTTRIGNLKIPALALIGLPIFTAAIILELIYKPQYALPVTIWLITGFILLSLIRNTK